MTLGHAPLTDRPAYIPTAARHATLDTYDAPIVDLFAGPGGWDEGAALIGVTNTYGLEFEANACATAEAAGHARMLGDLSSVDPTDYRPAVGLIASPPCQAWSRAGKQQAYLDRDACHELVEAYAEGDAASHTDIPHTWADPRSHLVAEPMRWAVALEPEWIVLEEVPTVIDLWATYHRLLESMGYSVWHGVLNAADYGVPQTRKRAILIASRTRLVHHPKATHSQEGDLLTEPWHTMEHVAPEGAEAFVATNLRPNSAVRKVTEPAPTLAFGHERPRWITMAEALGWGMTERPSLTVTGGGGDTGGAEPFGNQARQRMKRELEEGRWAYDRPATTVVGSFRPDIIAAPGWRKPGDGPRQNAAGSVRVECWEAGVLQSFRPDYPWQGAKTRAYQQVGNAVPPRLAAHVLAEAIGLDREAVLANIASYYEESRIKVAAIRSA